MNLNGYELPVDWTLSTLGEACKMYQPTTISKKRLNLDGDYPVYGANGVIGRHDQYNHEEPQLLVTCRGATCGSVNISDPFSWINGNAMVIQPINESISLRFLEYMFRGFIDFNSIVTGAAQPQITRSSLNPVVIPIPPLPTQCAIVARLDAAFARIDRARANLERNVANAKELFQAKLNEVFSRRGDGWEEKPLKKLTSKIGSGATPRGGKTAYKESGISLIRSLNVYDSGFTAKKLAFIDEEQGEKLNNVIVEKDDVLINITGASVARCCIAPNEYLPARVNQHVSIIRVKDDALLSDFLHFGLISKRYKKELLSIGDQGATRQAITKKQLQNFYFAYPIDISIQKDIIESINLVKHEVDGLTSKYQTQIQSLTGLKQSFLQKAFRGELIAEAEPETVADHA